MNKVTCLKFTHVNNKKKISMAEKTILSLPAEIFTNIVSYLSLSDVLNLMFTCKTMRNTIMNENALWRLISKKKFILINKSDQNFFSGYKKCRIFHNWCKGIYKRKVIIQHKINYMPWLHYDNSETLYLSVGSELLCYNLDRRGFSHNGYTWSFEVPMVKRNGAQTNDISRFVVKDNKIICGNRDGCVAIYELSKNKSKPHLLAHIKDCHEEGLEEVSAVEKVGDIIVTVSNRSDSICFWELNNDKKSKDDNFSSDYISKKVHILPNQICCRSIAANNSEDKLALGPCGQDKPMIFDVNTGYLSITSSSINYSRVIRDIQWLNEHCIAYVTYSGKVEIFDTRCYNVVYKTTDPFLSPLYCLKTDNDCTIVTGSSEFTRCVLYDIRSKYHKQMYFTQKKSSPVYCLHFDSTKLIAAADRGVATLNFNLNNSSGISRDYSQRFEFVKDDIY